MSKQYQANHRPNNPIRGRINSAFFAALDSTMHVLYGRRKHSLFANLPEEVVEIGPGAGANFRYYPKGQRVIAIEPNEYFHWRLKKRAERFGIELSIRSIAAERIDLPDNSSGAVISTLVLCTVDNPSGALKEIQRILKPGGRFIFLEHVASPRAGLVRWLQKVLHRPWHWFFEGCNLDRHTASLLENSGFTHIELEAFPVYSPFVPVTPHIGGFAIK